MENNREHLEEQRCRDYREEVETLEKTVYVLQEENKALKSEIDALKECIVKMSIARYLMNGT